MRFHSFVFGMYLILSIPTLLSAQPVPVGRWDFDDPSNLVQATTGTNLVLHGSQQAVSGFSDDDGAVHIGTGSYYSCSHGINPNGGGEKVNQWSLLIDFKVSSFDNWCSLIQTNSTNADDSDCCIHIDTGTIGIGLSGYSSRTISADTWYRLVVSANNATGAYNIYLDGSQILQYTSSELDGRFSLDSAVLLFADENGEDGPVTVSTVAVFDYPLSSVEVTSLGSVVPTEVPVPVGQWDFDVPDNLTLATTGNNLVLHGKHEAASGMNTSDGAVTIGVGSYYTCTHGIAPNGGGSNVNQWSLMIDFKAPSLSAWACLYQTNPTNSNDGECFISPETGTIGVGDSRYSSSGVVADTWYRIVISVDAAEGVYDIFLDGVQILDGNPPAVDGRFALASTILLFADNNGEDAPLTVSSVAIFDRSLNSTEIAILGNAYPKDPNNHVPEMIFQSSGTTTEAGTASSYIFEATDQDNDNVSFFINWGDRSTSGWTPLAPVVNPCSTSHTYDCPGTYTISAQVMDEHGRLSDVTSIQTVTVSGSCTPEFLAEPFLQNIKPDGITIMWELNHAVPSTLEYGLTNTYGSTISPASESSGNYSTIYKAVLTGLEPFTSYHYRIIASEATTADLIFRTGTDEHIDFAFSVWGDSQGTNGGLFPADPYEPTSAMMRHMRDDPEIHIGTNVGDLAQDGNNYTGAHEYYVDRVGKFLGQSKAWFSAWGNHDQGRSAVIRKFADFPSKDRTDLIDGLAPTAGWGSYSFDYAGCHFIMVDDSTRNSDVLKWVENDLKSEANQNARFTFVNVHRPPYCEVWIAGEAIYQTNLVPLMEKYGVDACFSGHTHGYGRGYKNGVFYCITGGGSILDPGGEQLVYDWPFITVGGYQPLAIDTSPLGLGGYTGMVNEYVKVRVTGNTWKATAFCFRPSGVYYGTIDVFRSTDPFSKVPEWQSYQ